MTGIIRLLVSTLLWPVHFVVGFWVSLKLSARYHGKAGYLLGERKALTGKQFDSSDVAALAQRLFEEDEQLAAHRERYPR